MAERGSHALEARISTMVSSARASLGRIGKARREGWQRSAPEILEPPVSYSSAIHTPPLRGPGRRRTPSLRSLPEKPAHLSSRSERKRARAGISFFPARRQIMPLTGTIR
jgi:hypothetical protein